MHTSIHFLDDYTVIVSDDKPDLYIDCDGISAKLVNIDDVAALFSQYTAYSTGVLPRNTLSLTILGPDVEFSLFVEPKIRTINVHGGLLRLPVPPLIFTGLLGRRPHIFAAREWPKTGVSGSELSSLLYRAPFPHINHKGGICWGSVASAEWTIPTAAQLVEDFFDGEFVGHNTKNASRLFPLNVIQMWHHLAETGAVEYPLDDLIPLGDKKDDHAED